jgi:hypothetical protein
VGVTEGSELGKTVGSGECEGSSVGKISDAMVKGEAEAAPSLLSLMSMSTSCVATTMTTTRPIVRTIAAAITVIHALRLAIIVSRAVNYGPLVSDLAKI